MITEDGLEHDVQPQEAGGVEDDYARPFGVPEVRLEVDPFGWWDEHEAERYRKSFDAYSPGPWYRRLWHRLRQWV